MTLAQGVPQIFCSQGPLWVKMPKSEKSLWKVNQVIYIMYPNCMPDITFLSQTVLQIFSSQGLLYYTKCQSQKREIIQSNIYRILPHVNQVIYSFGTICEPNIMILAQAVLEIFCSQGPLWVKCLSLKRAIIQSYFDRILWKVNQAIYINVPKPYAWYHGPSSSDSPGILFTILLYCQKLIRSSIFHAYYISNFKILSLTVLDCMQA